MCSLRKACFVLPSGFPKGFIGEDIDQIPKYNKSPALQP